MKLPLSLLKPSCAHRLFFVPRPRRPVNLYTDASQTALGYILIQTIEGRQHVVSYGGHELNAAEKHYSTSEHEALAVVDGTKCYRPYLFGAKFLVHTDHGSLSWLMNVKDPTGRLAQSSLQLQQYNFDIIHYLERIGLYAFLPGSQRVRFVENETMQS